jgi:hypothetical protein
VEVAVVVFWHDDARVRLGDVAEEVDPVARRDETQGLGVRAEEFRVVDDFL